MQNIMETENGQSPAACAILIMLGGFWPPSFLFYDFNFDNVLIVISPCGDAVADRNDAQNNGCDVQNHFCSFHAVLLNKLSNNFLIIGRTMQKIAA